MTTNLIYFNRYFEKNRLKALILWSLTKSGEKTTIDLVEKLKDFGFHYATQAGLSLGIDDLKIPPTKSELILEAEITIQYSQKEYEIGNVTIVEKFQQLLDIWHRTSEILKQNVIQHFRATNILNPVYMMAFSGARGNISQVRQLVGMRGLMADPQGQILDFPIRSNFREGLTLTEYVISCYGARKGLVDTALRTANSGYLTRRLVDVAQHIIVRQFDCRTKNGIFITEMTDGKKILFSLQKRLIGRVLAESIDPIAKRNQDISPVLALKIVKYRNQVLVRSPLSCEAKNSICQLCYGWSLAHGSLVSLGEAVGILAAQSIGEPGTQLTMRTFHTGGVFSGDVMQEIRSPFDGKVTFSNPLEGMLIRTLHGKIAFLTKKEGEFSISNALIAKKSHYNIPVLSVLFIRESEYVKERQVLAEYSSVVTTANQGIQANYNLISTMEGEVYFENVLLVIKRGKEGDILRTSLKFGSIWILAGKLYQSAIHSKLFINRNDLVNQNSLLTESIFINPYNGYLDKNFKEKRKYIFFNKKNIQLFDELSFLKKIIIREKEINKNQFLFPLRQSIKKIDYQYSVNQSFIQLNFQKIQYKKVGYFLSLVKSEKEKIFLLSSLNKNSIGLKNINLEWVRNPKLKKQGSIFFDENFVNEEKGHLFLKAENFYKIEVNKIVAISNKKDFQLVQKNQKILFFKNKQANVLSLPSKKTGLLKKSLLPQVTKTKSSNTIIFQSKRNFTKNPNIKFLKNSIPKSTLSYHQRHPKKVFLPTNLDLNKTKIRRLNFIFHKFQISKNNFLTSKENALTSKQNIIKTEKQNNFYLNIKIKTSWNSFPQSNLQTFILNKSFFSPTDTRRNYYFDQNYISIRLITLINLFFFMRKSYFLKKIRYINNKFFRYEKYQFLKSKQILKIYDLSSINRNKIYQNNFKYKNNEVIEITKLVELMRFPSLEQKKIFQKLIRNSDLNFFDLKKIFFNKQKTTKLINSFSSIDLKLKKSKINSFEKNQIISLNPIHISIQNKKNSPIHKGKLKIEFSQKINFIITQNIETINSTSRTTETEKTTKSKMLVTETSNVLEQNILTFHSFFSPCQGEITTVRTELNGKEKSLILTSKDQISFASNQKPILANIGQLVRYGDQIFQNIAIPESGQIIQIDQNKITIRKAQPILFSSQGIFHVDNGEIIKKNSPLITLFYQKLKTEDIVQGIPKIEELFEARQTKEGETLQENLHTKLKLFFKFYKQHYRPQQATRKSIEKIQQILVNNVQKVYQSQGVSIADKHIEIIVKQMTTKVKITESGRTGLLPGELVDLDWVELINLGIEAQNKMLNQNRETEKAEYEPIILGITKAALETESFISAASFQETTRILSRAAIERKSDFLRGLKENVILGHLIPAGTGFTLYLESQNKISTDIKKISWFSYKEIMKNFTKKR